MINMPLAACKWGWCDARYGWVSVQERDDLRKRTRQERLHAMRFNSFKSQLERERHAIAVQ